MNWPSYIKKDVGIVEGGGHLTENALMGEDFGWGGKKLAHTEAGKKAEGRGPVMEAMVDALKFFGVNTKSREVRKGCGA